MSPSAVDSYLNELCWAMGGSFAEQQAVRDEIRADISGAARDYELRGFAPNDALDRALRDLGDAVDLGRAMRSSKGSAPLQRPLKQPPGAVLLGRRHTSHLPPWRLAVALAAAISTCVAIVLIYTWP